MMDLIGRQVSVIESRDTSHVGLKGLVLLDSMKTVLIDTGDHKLRIPKAGTVFQIESTGEKVQGSEILGRMEDRLGRGASR